MPDDVRKVAALIPISEEMAKDIDEFRSSFEAWLKDPTTTTTAEAAPPRYTGLRCSECRHCAVMDTGYSNWTVMDTVATCMSDIHPQREWAVDAWGPLRDLPGDGFAATCPSFMPEGPGLHSNVDQDEVDMWTDEARAWWGDRSTLGS